jgi:hypothetical protein
MNSIPEKGLIVREPWISMIVDGQKSWELRGSRTSIRGRIALIAAGTGTIVGEASLTAVVGPIGIPELCANGSKHRVVANWELMGMPYRTTFAWELEDARRYDRPLTYSHPAGAVIWVNLAASPPLGEEKRRGRLSA